MLRVLFGIPIWFPFACLCACNNNSKRTIIHLTNFIFRRRKDKNTCTSEMILVSANHKNMSILGVCLFLTIVDYFPIVFDLCLLTNFDTFLRFVLFINRKDSVVFSHLF